MFIYTNINPLLVGSGPTSDVGMETMAIPMIVPAAQTLYGVEGFPGRGLQTGAEKSVVHCVTWCNAVGGPLEYGGNLMDSYYWKRVALCILYLIIMVVMCKWVNGSRCGTVHCAHKEKRSDNSEENEQGGYWNRGINWCRSIKFMGWSALQVFMFLVRSGQVEMNPGPPVAIGGPRGPRQMKYHDRLARRREGRANSLPTLTVLPTGGSASIVESIIIIVK